MEVMNESTILLMTYGQMGFTDLVLEPETRSLVGVYYIIVNLGNVLVHLIFLVLATLISCKTCCKEKYNCCRSKIPQAAIGPINTIPQVNQLQ